jgi:hypothetical protein
MKILKILLLAVFVFGLSQNGAAQTKKRQSIKKTKAKITRTAVKPMNNKTFGNAAESLVKTISEGAFSTVENSFVFVARSPETYSELEKLIDNLPPLSAVDFEKNAVIAAFAGTKNTSGYSVQIKKIADTVTIDVAAPPKDAMTAQVLTAPYTALIFSIENVLPLNLTVGADCKKAARVYKIVNGEFQYSGGFTGKGAAFDAEGTIEVLTFGNYATLIFKLSGKGAEKARKLSETASGTLKEEKISLARLDAGSFSEGPKPPVSANGTLTNDKVILSFEPLRANTADGFEVRGKLEALKIK